MSVKMFEPEKAEVAVNVDKFQEAKKHY